MANTTAPSTEAKRTSFTPYCIPVFVNMSSEKARAGIILHSAGQHRPVIGQAMKLVVEKKKLLNTSGWAVKQDTAEKSWDFSWSREGDGATTASLAHA